MCQWGEIADRAISIPLQFSSLRQGAARPSFRHEIRFRPLVSRGSTLGSPDPGFSLVFEAAILAAFSSALAVRAD
jgi:hypothetical protein